LRKTSWSIFSRGREEGRTFFLEFSLALDTFVYCSFFLSFSVFSFSTTKRLQHEKQEKSTSELIPLCIEI
jgi:hypothetical protein